MDDFQKSFVNVENVKIQTEELDTQLPLFIDLFPKMCRLILDGFISTSEHYATAVHFQNLEHLKFEPMFGSSEPGEMENHLIQSDPQLRILEIGMPYALCYIIEKIVGIYQGKSIAYKIIPNILREPRKR